MLDFEKPRTPHPPKYSLGTPISPLLYNLRNQYSGLKKVGIKYLSLDTLTSPTLAAHFA
jgi:hypothetical protein